MPPRSILHQTDFKSSPVALCLISLWRAPVSAAANILFCGAICELGDSWCFVTFPVRVAVANPARPLHCQLSERSVFWHSSGVTWRDCCPLVQWSGCPVDLEPFVFCSWRCFILITFSPVLTNSSALTACKAPDPKAERFDRCPVSRA